MGLEHARPGSGIDPRIDEVSEQRVFGMLALMPVPVAVFRGEELRCVFQNDHARAVLGGGSWLGKTPTEFSDDVQDLEALAVLDRVYRTGETTVIRDMPFQAQFDAGREQQYYDVKVQPYLTVDGAICGIMVVCNETTERIERQKFAEEADRKRAELETLIQAMPSGLS